VNVAVAPLTLTVPATPLTVKLDGVTEDGRMFSLNVAVTEAFVATLLALFAGFVAVTVGAVASAAAAVVNDQVRFAAMAFPAASRTPVVTVAV
jgi:hypothetical protein